MPTDRLFLGADSINKATSGSHYLLFEGGGYTGKMDLRGSARFDYVNSSGLAVQNNLFVTGSQIVHGNLTGFNFNSFARLSCTGDAYINNITGNLKIGGNVDLNNNLRVTGTCNISGSLILNGIPITGGGGTGSTIIISSGTTINNYYTSGSSSDFSTGNFTVSGSLTVRGRTNITGVGPYILNVSGSNNAAPVVNISGSSIGHIALMVTNGGAEANYFQGGYFQGGHRGGLGGVGLTVDLNPVPSQMVFEDGLLISYS
jgi:hypothetical protein